MRDARVLWGLVALVAAAGALALVSIQLLPDLPALRLPRAAASAPCTDLMRTSGICPGLFDWDSTPHRKALYTAALPTPTPSPAPVAKVVRAAAPVPRPQPVVRTVSVRATTRRTPAPVARPHRTVRPVVRVTAHHHKPHGHGGHHRKHR